ncbi:MAG: polyisoprenoid-binding protein YceI [Paraglaciecola sp.]|jgi:polyisoprenoid-binding protein YceI
MHVRTNSIKILALASMFFGTMANADWRLVNEDSNLNFISTKNINVSEVHHFNQLSGELSKKGTLSVEIDLASVKTGVAIRDTRMAEKLFLVDQFPTAKLSATLPDNVLALKPGQTAGFVLPATLKIMSTELPISVSVQVTRSSDGNITATSSKPILIAAADYGLQSGVELLQQIAGLSSIGLRVPVSFNLVFAQF